MLPGGGQGCHNPTTHLSCSANYPLCSQSVSRAEQIEGRDHQPCGLDLGEGAKIQGRCIKAINFGMVTKANVHQSTWQILIRLFFFVVAAAAAAIPKTFFSFFFLQKPNFSPSFSRSVSVPTLILALPWQSSKRFGLIWVGKHALPPLLALLSSQKSQRIWFPHG